MGVAAAQVPEPCGPAGGWPDGMACVTGGTFVIGDNEGRPDERPAGEVTLSSFFMDVTEVTNTAYRACMAAGDCPRHARYVGFLRGRQPVVGVSWQGAVDFCRSRGKRLPTDAEFERAARGERNTRFPWGDDEANVCDHALVRTRRGTGCGTEVTADVGSRPAGHFGLRDIAGSVHEWVADRYSPCLRGCARACGDACFGTNPRGPCADEASCPGHPLRSIRGGSWYWPAERARGAARRGARPTNEAGHRFGFRCAQSVEAALRSRLSTNQPENPE